MRHTAGPPSRTTGRPTGPAAIGATVALALLLGACGSGGGRTADTASSTTGPGPATSTSPTSRADDRATTARRWTSLLALVPDTPANRRNVTMTDLEAAATARGLDRPSADAGDDAIATYFLGLEALRGPVTTPIGILAFPELARKIDEHDAIRDELGWSMTEVDRTISAGMPPDTIWIGLGRFDPADVERRLADVPEWSDRQETVTHRGVPYYRWTAGTSPARDASPARPLGRADPMAVTEDRIAMADDDELMQATIDAVRDERTLVRNADVAAMAEALEGEPVFVVVATDDIPAPTGPVDAELAMTDVALVATAWGLDGDDGVSLLIVVSDDEAAAKRNVERFRANVERGVSAADGEPFASTVSVAGSEVRGRVAVVRLDTDRVDVVHRSLQRRDGLVLVQP